MKGPLIETEDLTMRFGGVAALTDINFRVDEGELRCLIGPNGAGKSTFFKCLTGQLTPSGGEVRLRGVTLNRLPAYQIARLGVGIKMQVPSVFETLTVAENVWIASTRSLSGSRATTSALQSMERLEIIHLSNVPLAQLAHGQRQLVELALVLAASPSLILLDEPAAGMTDAENDHLVSLIKELNRSHTLIIVEHDMHFIRRIASHVTVFNQGRILIEGGVDEVLGNSIVRDVYLGSEVN